MELSVFDGGKRAAEEGQSMTIKFCKKFSLA